MRATFPATVDPSTNVLETTVPRNALEPGTRPGVSSRRWESCTTAAPSSTADGPIYDLAFVGNESPARPRGAGNAWQDRDQADILSGRYASDGAIATVDFDLLARGENVIAEAREPGTHTFLYRSELELGGGIQPWPRKHNPELWTKFGMPGSAHGAVEDPRRALPALRRVGPGASADPGAVDRVPTRHR